jgi:hypothetical protein
MGCVHIIGRAIHGGLSQPVRLLLGGLSALLFCAVVRRCLSALVSSGPGHLTRAGCWPAKGIQIQGGCQPPLLAPAR